MARIPLFLFAAVTTLLVCESHAKPIHFEDLKFELIRQNVRCSDCHSDAEDKPFTRYGQVIADEGATQSIQDRVREVERSLSLTASDEEKADAKNRIDVDGDGVANWIEILAGTDVSTAGDRTEQHERIERVIGCTLCHESVAAFPRPGVERAPHNAFGDALENPDPRRAKRRSGNSSDTEDEDILERLKRSRRTDSDKDRIKDWDEVMLFYHPADKDDTPSRDLVKQFKQHLKDRKKNGGGFEPAHADE